MQGSGGVEDKVEEKVITTKLPGVYGVGQRSVATLEPMMVGG